VTVAVLSESQTDLLEIVLARGSARLLASGLNRWQKQGDQGPNDRNNHQEFDEGKAERTATGSTRFREIKRPFHVVNPWRNT
jgi:hypothetical protein